jgi:hypothetical protein
MKFGLARHVQGSCVVYLASPGAWRFPLHAWGLDLTSLGVFTRMRMVFIV